MFLSNETGSNLKIQCVTEERGIPFRSPCIIFSPFRLYLGSRGNTGSNGKEVLIFDSLKLTAVRVDTQGLDGLFTTSRT